MSNSVKRWTMLVALCVLYGCAGTTLRSVLFGFLAGASPWLVWSEP